MAKKTNGISGIFAKMTIIPILFLGTITSIFGVYQVKTSMEKEVENELKGQVKALVCSFDALYEGDYQKYSNDEEILITKGDIILNSNYKFIDNLKSETNVDYTIFYGDMRVITTICDDSGARLSGTKANSRIVSDVINSKKSTFYKNVDVVGNKQKYYCYYEPLYNSKEECIGMVAAIVPAKRIIHLTYLAALPVILLAILATVIINIFVHRYSMKYVTVIRKIQDSLNKTAKGQLSNTVPPDLLSRKDEFGDIGHSIVEMQTSLRALVERDMLTGLYNRRYGQQRFEQLLKKAVANHNSFSIALGDIDFFKKFNDNYGHDCGDIVLKQTARFIQKTIKNYGYCSRWGGEEFLIVFTHGEYNTHEQLMEELVSSISSNVLIYNEQELSVSMTFGLVEVIDCDNVDKLLKITDDLLYYGKEHGRNQLVTEDKLKENA